MHCRCTSMGGQFEGLENCFKRRLDALPLHIQGRSVRRTRKLFQAEVGCTAAPHPREVSLKNKKTASSGSWMHCRRTSTGGQFEGLENCFKRKLDALPPHIQGRSV